MYELDEVMALTVAFVSGLFLLLGVFAGAFVGRRTEYEKWLRSERAKVFADLLRFMNEAFAKSSDMLHNPQMEGLERNIEITKVYSVPLNHARIVRLYLPASERERFEKIARSVCALHSTKELGDKRIIQVEEMLNEIQSIFERHL
jgi:hypothetical protein